MLLTNATAGQEAEQQDAQPGEEGGRALSSLWGQGDHPYHQHLFRNYKVNIHFIEYPNLPSRFFPSQKSRVAISWEPRVIS